MAEGSAPNPASYDHLIIEWDLSGKRVLDLNQGGLQSNLHAIEPFRKVVGIDITETSFAEAQGEVGFSAAGGTCDP